ncbi:hypothetical protein CAG70_00020 [Photobacterium halotolerans]|uniref:hypothetical protein n=1 Tax=Photobacterium halotolerans TaxID=265726 RepID=UPI0013737CDD|nr:hypothetical protein [Photobacterium halotolerans]NAX45395.1 hypothetical protein [Photobacterium halotolerans]
MIRYLFSKMLLAFKNRYDYDIRYQQDILKTDLGAFLKFMGFQTMSSHSGNLPAGPLYAARIRAIIWDDCGPCTQLAVNMALEAKISPDIVQAIINKDFNNLPDDIALVVKFTESVLAHHPEADDYREKILALWGPKELITIGFAISTYRVYPALKYTLGYGKTCQRIRINASSITPERDAALTGEVENAE